MLKAHPRFHQASNVHGSILKEGTANTGEFSRVPMDLFRCLKSFCPQSLQLGNISNSSCQQAPKHFPSCDPNGSGLEFICACVLGSPKEMPCSIIKLVSGCGAGQTPFLSDKTFDLCETKHHQTIDHPTKRISRLPKFLLKKNSPCRWRRPRCPSRSPFALWPWSWPSPRSSAWTTSSVSRQSRGLGTSGNRFTPWSLIKT